MATCDQAERFLMPLQDAIVTAGQGAGLSAEEAVDMALRYAVELHANNCGVHATAALLTESGERGFRNLLAELGAALAPRRGDA